MERAAMTSRVLPAALSTTVAMLNVGWFLLTACPMLRVTSTAAAQDLVNATTVDTVNATTVILMNVAAGRPTRQTDAYNRNDHRYGSQRAVDGMASQGISGSCSLTRSRSDTWWMVDLQVTRQVHGVNILNSNSQHRVTLKDIYVYVSENSPVDLLPPPPGGKLPGKLCLHHQTQISSTGKQHFPCDANPTPLIGRFVYIWKPGDSGWLTLCEFEVLATHHLREFSVSVLRGVRTLAQPSNSFPLDPGQPIRTRCVSACLNLKDTPGYAMQLNHRTGNCSCFTPLPFQNYAPVDRNVTPDGDYDVMGLFQR